MTVDNLENLAEYLRGLKSLVTDCGIYIVGRVTVSVTEDVEVEIAYDSDLDSYVVVSE